MDKKFLKLLIIILFILKYLKFLDIEYKYLIIITLIIIGIISGGYKLEHLETDDIAIISGIYNDNNMKVNNLEVLGTFITADATISKLNVTDNITSVKTTGTDVFSERLDCLKNMNINGNINIKGDLTASTANIQEFNYHWQNLPKATIGSWDIRGNKIGIKNKGDLNWDGGNWLRLLEYDQPGNGTYANPGFDAKSLHLHPGIQVGNV